MAGTSCCITGHSNANKKNQVSFAIQILPIEGHKTEETASQQSISHGDEGQHVTGDQAVNEKDSIDEKTDV